MYELTSDSNSVHQQKKRLTKYVTAYGAGFRADAACAIGVIDTGRRDKEDRG